MATENPYEASNESESSPSKKSGGTKTIVFIAFGLLCLVFAAFIAISTVMAQDPGFSLSGMLSDPFGKAIFVVVLFFGGVGLLSVFAGIRARK